MQIELTRGLLATVDDVDADWVRQWSWQAHVHPKDRTSYARRVDAGRAILLHREIARRAGLAIDGLQVDHINGDGLDNRRCNLRAVTATQNSVNYVHKRRRCSSRFKRVAWHAREGKWLAYVRQAKRAGESGSGKQHSAGYFDCEVSAALFADLLARDLHGVAASLNFPDVVATLPPLARITGDQIVAAIAAAAGRHPL